MKLVVPFSKPSSISNLNIKLSSCLDGMSYFIGNLLSA